MLVKAILTDLSTCIVMNTTRALSQGRIHQSADNLITTYVVYRITYPCNCTLPQL